MISSKSILVKLFTEYYFSATQAKKEGRPIAWISAFTPVEILRAMDITCLYPESYAVVCSASGKAPEMIQASKTASFTQDLCSYSLIGFGTEHAARLPYGGLPQPDFLVATNNQCGTIPLWFQLLAQKKNIPLFTIDYPADAGDLPSHGEYIRKQHEALVVFVNKHTSQDLSSARLAESIEQSCKACDLWKRIHELNCTRPPKIEVGKIVDALFPIVTMRGIETVCDYYHALLSEYADIPDGSPADVTRLLWHGYPMWFLPGRFPRCFDEQFRIILDDYALWWNLEYGKSADTMDALTQAYSSTYLNWPIQKRVDWVSALVKEYAIDGVILHANRSCRRCLADIVPIRDNLSKKGIRSVVIESDMANPANYSTHQVALRIESFRDTFKVKL